MREALRRYQKQTPKRGILTENPVSTRRRGLVFLTCLLVAGYALFRHAPFARAVTVWPTPCNILSDCPLQARFDSTDPEGDPLTATFTAVPAVGTYTISKCELWQNYGFRTDGQPELPPLGSATLLGTTVPPSPQQSCVTPASPGPGTYNAISYYRFSSVGTHTANYQVCDNAGHCATGSYNNLQVVDINFSWANPDHAHDGPSGGQGVNWKWLAA